MRAKEEQKRREKEMSMNEAQVWGMEAGRVPHQHVLLYTRISMFRKNVQDMFQLPNVLVSSLSGKSGGGGGS